MLKLGTSRRVGSGTDVDILHNPWLPCVHDPFVHTKREALNGKKVVSLMMADQSSWDIDLIHDIFNSRDVNLILSIPLQHTVNDSCCWRKGKMGQYSVKSVYSTICDRIEANQLSSNSGFWRKIWNLKISLKVKHFLWRALTGCLPTIKVNTDAALF